MITEKRFAASHHGFWHELLPMGEHYIRTVNLEAARFEEPLIARAPPAIRGIVNEVAFRLFSAAVSATTSVGQLDGSVVADALVRSTDFIRNFRQHGRGPLPTPGAHAVQEAKELAKRTEAFFSQSASKPLIVQPRFRGCGWLSACDGDVFSSGVLYEIKSGARPFRTADVKQVLVYCALDFASKEHDVQRVCFVNPREGTYFSESLNDLCILVSGRSSTEVLSELVEYISERSGQEIPE